MKTEDNPYYKCLVCGEYVNPSVGHIAGPEGTMHWHCHPQLKYKSDVYMDGHHEPIDPKDVLKGYGDGPHLGGLRRNDSHEKERDR